jgi:methylglutaconyl-CoA hydratase
MIKFDVKDDVGILTINRPDKRNALHPEVVKQLKIKLNELEKSRTVKVLILTGEGKAFCAGADLEYLDQLRQYSLLQNEKDSRELAALFTAIYNFPIPVIAAVNGAALAGGCGLASVCDIIVADENNATFGYPEVKIGFIPAIVSTFVIRRLGEGLARQLLLSGEIISAKQAYEVGFVNYLKNNALTGALEVASMLKTNSGFSMELTKNMINRISGCSVEDAVEYCISLNALSRTSVDFKEGLQNFIKKKRG